MGASFAPQLVTLSSMRARDELRLFRRRYPPDDIQRPVPWCALVGAGVASLLVNPELVIINYSESGRALDHWMHPD